MPKKFLCCAGEDGDKNAALLLRELKKPETMAYLLFLKYVLNIFNTFNALFQGRNILIHKLVSASESLFKELCYNCIKLNELNNLQSLNLSCPRIFKELKEVYLGPKCEEYLKSIPQNIAHDVRLKCLDYYTTAAQELQRRLPLKNIVLQELIFIDPKVALDGFQREAVNNFQNLKKQFGHMVDFDAIEVEWRNLHVILDEDTKNKLRSIEHIDEMWYELSLLEDYSGEKKFSNLYNLVKIALSMPHSNAEAERVFSIVTDVKTKKRNRLGTESLDAVCVFRSALQSKSLNCIKFEVTKEHLEKHDNLY